MGDVINIMSDHARSACGLPEVVCRMNYRGREADEALALPLSAAKPS